MGSLTARPVWLAFLSLLATAIADSNPTVEFPAECDGVATNLWTSAAHRAEGYHVLCVGKTGAETCASDGSDAATCNAQDGKLPVTVCWDGERNNCQRVNLGNSDGPPGTLLELEEQLQSFSPLYNPERYGRLQKALKNWKGLFAFFHVPDTNAPVRIRKAEDISGFVLVFEGGSFIWPGIEVGFKRNVTIKGDGPSDTEIHVELLTRGVQPLIIEVSSFVDAAECAHIIGKATPHVVKSAVSHMDHDVGKPDANWRSSSTYFMPSDDDLLKRLDRRVAALTRVKKTHQEYSQILRYTKGERYAAHHDYFDPNMYKESKQIQGMTKKGLFNRLATVFFYLSTVEKGGHTNFPRAGGLKQPGNFEKCDTGVSIDPQEGRIVIFYSQDPAARLDPYSLHGGCAVEEGVKWSANKWLWTKPMDFIREGE